MASGKDDGERSNGSSAGRGYVKANPRRGADAIANYVPPHSIEAEQAVLGAIIIQPVAIEKISGILIGEDFYRESHVLIYDAVQNVSARNDPVDLLSIRQELTNKEQLDQIGGMSYLTALFDSVPSASNVEYYAKIVADKATLRRLVDTALDVVGMVRNPENDDVDVLVDQAERDMFAVAKRHMGQYFTALSPLLVQVYDRAQDLNELKARISGLSTGIQQFDMITSGLQNSDLVIIAARPSMGKTSLCLSVAQHVAMREHKTCAIFSIEMSKEQLALRMLCSEAQVNAHRVRTGYLNDGEWSDLNDVVNRMYDAPIYIDDSSEITPLTMRAKCRRLQAEHGLGLIIVDYLQLMQGSKRTENRVQEIGDIARGLKALGREMNVPVIALSQLSRAVEHRENKRPMLSDLRESGSIEAEADLVCFLYRQSYYDMKEAVAAGETFERGGSEVIEETEIIIGKHRNGPTGVVKVGFMPDYAKFVNIDASRSDDD